MVAQFSPNLRKLPSNFLLFWSKILHDLYKIRRKLKFGESREIIFSIFGTKNYMIFIEFGEN